MDGQAVTAPSPGVGWYWRRGVPLATGLAALAAAGGAVAWLLDLDAAAKMERSVVPLPAACAVAAAFAATLLTCWGVVGRRGPDSPLGSRNGPLGSGNGPLRSGSGPLRPADALAAVAVILTSVVLAAHHLDELLRWDETRTFDYATRSFAVAASAYKEPNNHVLHSLLVRVAHEVGGWNRVALRMPAFLSFCLLLPVLWWFARREYGPRAAALATALVGTSPYFVAYGTSARGYTLMLLMFATMLLCARVLVRTPEKKALWAMWAAAVTVGLYTLPLALPAVTTMAWMAMTRWRRCGREAFGSFVARMVAWSVAAVAVAVVLYLPVLLGNDLAIVKNGVQAWWPMPSGALAVVAHPVVLWREWHWTVPAWAQGVILALVVVGAAVPERTSGRGGTLLLAGLLAIVSAPAYGFWPQSRMLIWALLACMVAAGAGAALVLERAVDRAGARWPTLVAGPWRRALECAAVALVLGASSWWTTRPGALTANTDRFRTLRELPLMALSVAEQLRPGDYLAVCGRVEIRTMAYVKSVVLLEEDVGWYYPLQDEQLRQRVHRVAAEGGGAVAARGLFAATGGGAATEERFAGTKGQVAATEGRVVANRGPIAATEDSAFVGEASSGRLFLLESLMGEGRPRCFRDRPPATQRLEAEWPDHELVAGFRMGRVYALNEWTGPS